MRENAESAPLSVEEEACAWVELFVVNKGSREDLAALKRWMARSPAHAEAFDRVSRTWASLDRVADALSNVSPLSHGPARTWKSPPIGRRALIGGALATGAAAAVAAGVTRPPLDLWPSLAELGADVRTRPGEQRQLALDGHVSIELNTRSSLAMLAPAEVKLISGEAEISTPSGSEPFRVLVAGGNVSATSGRFNVRLDDDVARATCLTGQTRVAVGAAGATLTPGQQVRFSASGLGEPSLVDVDLVTSWRDGIVIFDAAPVKDVIAEVNRYRPGRIILTNSQLGRRLFSARIRVDSIGNIVRQLELAFGARARTLPGDIVLLG